MATLDSLQKYTVFLSYMYFQWDAFYTSTTWQSFCWKTLFSKPGNIYHSLGCQVRLTVVQKFQNVSAKKQQFSHLLIQRWCRCLKPLCLLHVSETVNISSLWFLFSATYFLENVEALHLLLQILCQVPFIFFFLHFCLTRLLYGDKCSFLLTPHNRCVKHTHMFW